MANGPSKQPQPTPPPRKIPAEAPHHDDRGLPRETPEMPGAADPPASREPGPPPTVDPDGPERGAVAVDFEEAHMGATEEQVGDRTGSGAGYDEARKKS